MNKPHVFITGGTGFIGRKVLQAFDQDGWTLTALTRNIARAQHSLGDGPLRTRVHWIAGDAAQPGAWQEQVAGCSAVVALAGEPIFKDRWNEAVKQTLIRSRVDSARHLVQAIAAAPESERPATLISASSYGWYPPLGASQQDESSQTPGDDFLARLSLAWEVAADQAATQGVRVVQLRFGLVLSHDGGLLEGLMPRFKLFLGGPVGSGRQYLPMIHADDAIQLTRLALARQDIAGPLNLVMPQTPTMAEFAQALGRALDRPAWLRLPEAFARLKLGEAADAILSSRRVIPAKAEALGYRFLFPDIDSALTDILSKKS